MASPSVTCLNCSGVTWPSRFFTWPLTWAVLALPALSTATLTTPWVLLRVSPTAAATSGCRKLELKAL
ncbi:hypothetical protein D3C81_1756490 [compost metagenome]